MYSGQLGIASGRVRRVVFTAAHGGFAAERVPLGGGAAVCDALADEWRRQKPFELEVVDPSILGARSPKGRDLTGFSEQQYAAFCREFEAAATAHVLRHDPAETAVLSNDVSEGPDFARLAAAGFRVHTIYHVDVVAYVSAIYARGFVSPPTLAKLARWARPVLPDIARLVFDKQEASVRHSRKVVVPSARMRGVIASCYPGSRADLVEVLPWGTWAMDPDETALASELASVRAEFGVEADAQVVLTLSRISPEKGQDRLLNALIRWERETKRTQPEPLHLFVCGEAAFMQGGRFLTHLRELAERLQRVKVHFPGFVTGLRKQAFFRLADVYVFPSRHESYGLTLMEALHAGLPAICLDHHGSDEIVQPEFGVVAREADLAGVIFGLLADPKRRAAMGRAAKEFARSQPFSRTAARLADLISSES